MPGAVHSGLLGCRIWPLLHLASHLAHFASGKLDGFAAHGLGQGWEEETASPGEGVAGEGVSDGGGGTGEARVPPSPLFAQLVDGSHDGEAEQDAQVLQLGFPRRSLGTCKRAQLDGGISVPSTPHGTQEPFRGEGEPPTGSGEGDEGL